MESIRKRHWQWILTGTLSTGLALTPALVAQTQQQTPPPGQQGDWGQAGPPPDAQNGQIPPPNQSGDQNDDQGPPQYPGQATDQTPAPNSSQAPAPAPGVGYGQPPRPAYQPNQGYGYQGQAAPATQPSGPVTLNPGMLLQIRTDEPLDSKKVKPGDYFQGTVAQNVYIGSVLAIPRGAQVTGRVEDVKKAGDLKGGASIALQLTSLNLGGNTYPIATDTFDANGPGKGGYTAANTVGGAVLGAAIGAVAGGGPGAAIGAAAGTGVGLGASAATPGPRSAVPAEALLTFHLTSPVTVQPVSSQEAAQIERSVAPPPGYGPRPAYGPAYGYAPPPPAYAPYPYPYAYPYAYAYPYPYAYAYGYPYYYRRWR